MASCTLEQQVERYCSTFGLMHSWKADIMGRLDDFERTMAQPPYNTDPADVRRLLTLQMKAVVEHALTQPQHKDYFVITERNLGTVRSTAKRWNVTSTQVLFSIAHDHAKQGQKFFSALKTLSEISPVWDDTISLLCGIASARRAKDYLNKRQGIRRSAEGPILSDVKLAIESLKSTPEASGTAAASPMSSNQAENTADDDMSENTVEDHDVDGDDFIVTGIDEALLSAIARRIATIIVNCMDGDAIYEEDMDMVGTDEHHINENDMDEDEMDEDEMGDNGVIVAENDFGIRDGHGGEGDARYPLMNMVQPTATRAVASVEVKPDVEDDGNGNEHNNDDNDDDENDDDENDDDENDDDENDDDENDDEDHEDNYDNENEDHEDDEDAEDAKMNSMNTTSPESSPIHTRCD